VTYACRDKTGVLLYWTPTLARCPPLPSWFNARAPTIPPMRVSSEASHPFFIVLCLKPVPVPVPVPVQTVRLSGRSKTCTRVSKRASGSSGPRSPWAPRRSRQCRDVGALGGGIVGIRRRSALASCTRSGRPRQRHRRCCWGRSDEVFVGHIAVIVPRHVSSRAACSRVVGGRGERDGHVIARAHNVASCRQRLRPARGGERRRGGARRPR